MQLCKTAELRELIEKAYKDTEEQKVCLCMCLCLVNGMLIGGCC